SPRSVILTRQATLAGRFALRRIRDRVVMVALGSPLRLPPPCLDRLTRRLGRDQAVAPGTDELATPRIEQGLPHHEIILGLEELHQRPLHLSVPQTPRRRPPDP